MTREQTSAMRPIASGVSIETSGVVSFSGLDELAEAISDWHVLIGVAHRMRVTVAQSHASQQPAYYGIVSPTESDAVSRACARLIREIQSEVNERSTAYIVASREANARREPKRPRQRRASPRAVPTPAVRGDREGGSNAE